MKIEDLRPQGAGWVLRLHEKGGKHHMMPCHHALAEALRAYVRACRSKELRTRLGRNAADVALAVPEVRDRLPDMPAAPAGIDEYGRYRVFESVSEFVLAIARSAPGAGLVLCLDDLHWGDQTTLLLLKADGSLAWHDHGSGVLYERFLVPALKHTELLANQLRSLVSKMNAQSPIHVWDFVPGLVLCAAPLVDRRGDPNREIPRVGTPMVKVRPSGQSRSTALRSQVS